MFARRAAAVALVLSLAVWPAAAQAPLPPPLTYAQNLEPLGPALVLRQVRCQAQGQGEPLGRLYLKRVGLNQYRLARTEYNEQGKWVLEKGKDDPAVARYYRKYVLERQPLSLATFDFLLGLWRVFGYRFTIAGQVYQCQNF